MKNSNIKRSTSVLTHLSEIHCVDQETDSNANRLTRLAAFQKKALEHALSCKNL